jgi:hypothetical protein
MVPTSASRGTLVEMALIKNIRKNKMSKNKRYTASLTDFLRLIKQDTKLWDFSKNPSGSPWYRGQDRDDGPIPKLFRGNGYNEFELTKMFRERAGAFGNIPETDRIDKWLFLMQHYGTATRLLDWTESPLIALYFALDSYYRLQENEKSLRKPTIWALNPLILNSISGIDGFPNTWTRDDRIITKNGKSFYFNYNPGVEYFRLAFHPKAEWSEYLNMDIVKLPISVQTNYIDLRMYSQRSCFTIHGCEVIDFASLHEKYLKDEEIFLYSYEIASNSIIEIFNDLKSLGVNNATLFPDLQGISIELSERFKI